MNNRKALSPVVATALLIVVAVVSVVGFQTWFGNYNSGLFSKTEITSKLVTDDSNLKILDLIGNTLYVNNNVIDNLSINNLKIGNVNCSITQNLSLGINEIDVESCLSNVSTSTASVVLITNIKILGSQMYIGPFVPTPNLDCDLVDGVQLNNTQSAIFYNMTENLVCYSQQRTCLSGSLNGSSNYQYSNCTIIGTFNLSKVLNDANAYGTSDSDNFGWGVAISGNYAIVGAYQEDDASGLGSGKAYIYNVINGNLLYNLSNPNPNGTSDTDYFGSSVSISGNYAIVGAHREDDSSGVDSGKAYIYNISNGNLLYNLSNPNAYGTSDTDYFGYSVAISGNYALVGAYQEDDAGGLSSGEAYIYNVSNGNLLYNLSNPNASGTSANDIFGYSVAISGNYAIIGAYTEDDACSGSGKAYIYNVSNGNLLYNLSNPNSYNTCTNDFFGQSVSISGNYAIVGALGEDDASGLGSGKAYIYNVSSGNLLFTLNNPNPYGTSANDQFSYSVGISELYALSAAYREDTASATDSGKAYIYNISNGNLLFTLDNPTNYSTGDSDYFGWSAAISGNYAIIGAHQEDDAGGTNSGKAYVFR